MPGPSRRDFLKLGSALSGGLAASRFLPGPTLEAASGGAARANVIILVFDAMAGPNLSVYGYPRKTTPNLERFAARANVYHRNYSADNFTTPGVASILTGLYPWTHRAINHSGLITPSLADHNIFRALGPQYHRLAYSQNLWPNYFFGQFEGDIERVLSPGAFSLLDQVVDARFRNDLVNSHRAFADLLFHDEHAPASLVFGLAENLALYEAVARASKEGRSEDIARADNYPIFFHLKDVFDGLLQTIVEQKAPFLAYLHTWSPHAPYAPSHEFTGAFVDDWHPVEKPLNVFGPQTRQRTLDRWRVTYDQYIADVDFEFGRLLDGLQARGILDTSYLVVTSDHGELFERGVNGHATPLLYEPVVHVPLLISSPGQAARRDITLPTSNVDLLPTLVHLAGGKLPARPDGQILPGLGGPEDPERSIFISEATNERPDRPWREATFVLRKGPYKLIYYMGYEKLDRRDKFELYDIDADPEELRDRYSESSATAQDLRNELLRRIQLENARYERPG